MCIVDEIGDFCCVFYEVLCFVCYFYFYEYVVGEEMMFGYCFVVVFDFDYFFGWDQDLIEFVLYVSMFDVFLKCMLYVFFYIGVGVYDVLMFFVWGCWSIVYIIFNLELLRKLFI